MLPWTRLSIDQSSLQGCTGVTLRRRISRVAYTLLGSTPPKLSDTKKPILRKTTERSFAGLYPMYAGLWTLTRTYSCTVRDWTVKQKQMANTTHTHRSSKRRQHHFPAISPRHCRHLKTLRRDYDAGEPTLLIPHVGSAYKPEGYSRHSPDQLSIFINLHDNRYRCLDLTDSRSTTAARTTSNVGACPVVPSSHCGYQQGEPSPYLVSRLLRRARLSYYKASHGHEQGPDPRWYPFVLSFQYNPCAGTIGSPDSLPSSTPVDSGSYQQVQPGGVTLDGTLEMVRQRHQWNELKRNILVSPRWCRDTSGMN